ncbi:MAG: hypothetical protein AVDCRST_MAG15-1334, partial [uncultured Rubellimicrobium sp.]
SAGRPSRGVSPRPVGADLGGGALDDGFRALRPAGRAVARSAARGGAAPQLL